MADFEDKEKAEKEPKEEEEEDDNGPAPDDEGTATFTPVVVLQKVEVKTHEEEEEVLYSQRCKLYVFGETMLNRGTGDKSWNERGKGDVRLLKHKESGRIRVLMRQEKTMKITVNHFVDPRIKMIEQSGSDKAWVWVAYDFADGELVETTFSMLFGSPEKAQDFKESFEKYQVENQKLMSGEDSAEGAKEADDAADALANLSVKNDGEGENEEATKEDTQEKETAA